MDLINGITLLSLRDQDREGSDEDSSRNGESSSSTTVGYPLVRETIVQTKFRPLIWILRTLPDYEGTYSFVSMRICEEYSMVWKRKKGSFSKFIEFATIAGAVNTFQTSTGGLAVRLAPRHRLLRQPVPPVFLPLMEQIMRFPSSRVLCSRIANILLRHKAQPLADKSWRIHLAEAVDAGLVETGTEGIGREWVQVANDLWV